jgi:SET domain-containing protein
MFKYINIMYKPLPNYLIIKNSDIHGLGIFAARNISKNTIIGLTHVFNSEFDNNYIRTPMGGFYNHSNNPNCKSFSSNSLLSNYEGQIVNPNNLEQVNSSSNFRYLIAIDDINTGDEITSFYNLYKI